GFFDRHRRFGLGELGFEIAVVDDKQNGTFGDLLVVGDLDLFYIALDLRADQRDVALDIGIVGRLQKAQNIPPLPAAADAGGEHQNRQKYEQELAQASAPGWPELNRSVQSCAKMEARLKPVKLAFAGEGTADVSGEATTGAMATIDLKESPPISKAE